METLVEISDTEFRDWNEELQNYKKIDAKDFYDHLNKAKIHERIQKDFLEAALEGAKAIVEGKLASMNVSIQQNDKCYIYNNIFYTFCSDDYAKVNQPRGEDAPSTVVTASKDMDNMKILEDIDGKDVHTVQTALIKYRGYCVTAQSLIQGILYYDEKTWTKYGSVDEGKTISNDSEFDTIIKKISQMFYAKDDLVYLDQEGKEHKMASSIDIKGILGGDGRKYVLDLFRMCPRDVNWEGPDYDAVVFRRKLVENYLYNLKLEITEQIRSNYNQKINDIKQQQHEYLVTASKKLEGKELTPEETEERNTEIRNKLQKSKDELQKIQIEMLKEIEEEIKKQNLNDYRFDTSLYSGLESHYGDASLLELEREKLRKLAAFAKEKMAKTFVDEWMRMGKLAPIDTQSLMTALHNVGLSSRHLGYVIHSIDSQTNMKSLLLAQRAVIVRCIKHLLEHVLRTVPTIQLSDTMSHLLNCIIANTQVSEFLEQKVANLSKRTGGTGVADTKEIETMVEGNGGDKKKKKKKSKKVQSVKCDIEPNMYMLISPRQLFDTINSIAESRYKYKFAEKSFSELIFTSNPIDRSSLLREISLSIGLCLGFRDFNFENQDNPASLELPIKPTDIGEFTPIIKKQECEFSYAKINYTLGAQYVANGKYESAIDVYSSTLQALLNVSFYNSDLRPLQSLSPRVRHHSRRTLCNSVEARTSSGHPKGTMSSYQSVLKLTEKTYGIDNLMTLTAYVDLARYYYEMDNSDRTTSCLLAALYLADLVGGTMVR